MSNLYIMRQMGHRSSAVRAYKRPAVAHDMLVSAILQPPKKSKLDDEQCVLPSVATKSFGGVWTLYSSVRFGTPFQMGMEKPHIHSLKENYPSPHNLPVVLNFNFG